MIDWPVSKADVLLKLHRGFRLVHTCLLRCAPQLQGSEDNFSIDPLLPLGTVFTHWFTFTYINEASASR